MPILSCETPTVIVLPALLSACARPAEDPPPPAEDTDPRPTVTDPPTTTSDGLVVAAAAGIHPDIGSIVVVTWEQVAPADAWVAFEFDPGDLRTTPVRSLPAGTHTALLLGVPFDTDVSWQVIADDGVARDEGRRETIATGPLPTATLAGSLSVADPSRFDAVDAPYWFVSLADGNAFDDPWYTAIVDRQGRAVWAVRTPPDRIALHARVARDGRSLLLDRNSYWPLFDGGASSTVDRVHIDGSVAHTYAVPGLHHPFVDLPDGSLAWGATVQGYQNEYVKVVHEDGSTETIFDCMDWLGELGVYGFCMSNTLSYDESRNELLFSLFSTDSILRIDRATGAVTATWGHLPGSWAFDPPGSAFWWQHGGHVTPTGTLLTSSDLSVEGVETVVREYTIDEAASTLREVWSYGVGNGVYGHQLGEVERLENGNTLHNYGELARVVEVTPDGEIVWQLDWDSFAIGRSMPIRDLYALQPE